MLAKRDEREPGETFSPGDILWIDFETKGGVPIEMGTHKYALHAKAIILSWAIGEGPVTVTAVETFERALAWDDMPDDFRAMAQRVFDGEAVMCAHNAPFDRAVWNHSTHDFPWLGVEEIIDSRVQAVASGLPAKLEFAGRFSGQGGKHEDGGKLIDLFTLPESTATPESHPVEWDQFCDYADQDTVLMRKVFNATRQLPLAEWKEYWAAQAISERGIGIDLELAQAAARMAAIDKQLTVGELIGLTDGKVKTIDSIKSMIIWLQDALPFDGREILVKRQAVVDEETGEIKKPTKYDLPRQKVEKLLAYLWSLETLTDEHKRALRVLELRLYGGSKASAKFSRMLEQHVDGVVSNSYIFHGTHTGRFSSRGVQVHNMTRAALPYEADVIDALVDGISAIDLAVFGDDTPRSRKLALIIRPTLTPRDGNAFAWCDWSAIEARVLPFLAGTPEAQKRLDIFTQVDADPSIPDIYVRSASDFTGIATADIMHVDEHKHLRDDGKIIELASGFGGGADALLSRAAATGKHYTHAEAKGMIETWRRTNAWAPAFWDEIWQAILSALEDPGVFYTAGRLTYVFLDSYLGGSLMCILPSTRCVVYRRCRWERIAEVDEDTGEIIDYRRHLTFAREMGRVKLWYGLAVENAVQAAAADLMRGTLRRLEEAPDRSWMPVRLHTHDEILVESAIEYASTAAAMLKTEMERGFDWTRGLPLKADARTGRWYTKAKKGAEL
jgi:DNA polymerase